MTPPTHFPARTLARVYRRSQDVARRLRFAMDRSGLEREISRHGEGCNRDHCGLELTIDRSGIGMFAELNWLVYGVAYARALGIASSVKLRSDTYFDPRTDDVDWLDQYFDMSWRDKAQASRHVIRRTISSLDQLPRFPARVGRMSLWEAHWIAKQSLRPLPRIQATVDRFVHEHLGGDFVGIHWRGTDKVKEASAVPVEQIVEKAAQILSASGGRPSCFYFASDDAALTALLRVEFARAYSDIPVVTRSDVERSTDGCAMHTRKDLPPETRKQMGEDALVDCLILSRGRALIRTASFLSGWCSVFKPMLPTYLLNAPYDHCLWFPDKEVLYLSDYFNEKLTEKTATS